eukprot:GILI01026760.1.p1 GENE.GILI01026760.1~~GILI01026760.1.p1  ORF type:complete len:471 (-),score=93.82 GILI01026760.1:30-1349(-)
MAALLLGMMAMGGGGGGGHHHHHGGGGFFGGGHHHHHHGGGFFGGGHRHHYGGGWGYGHRPGFGAFHNYGPCYAQPSMMSLFLGAPCHRIYSYSPYQGGYYGGGGGYYGGCRYRSVNIQDTSALTFRGGINPIKPYEFATPYSQGRVKGLFIGINYFGTQAELKGCCNDVALMIDTLKTLQFPLQEAAILVDDPSFAGASGLPTRDNIIQHMMWLVKDTRPGDVLFFHYSGHGSNLEEGGAETQMLVPMDFQSEGVIVDDDIFELMVRNLPEGVRMTAVMDCCHSGSLMDLPFTFVPDPRQAQLAAGNFRMTAERSFGMRQSRGDVVLFSGCEDGQVSADSSNAAAQFGNRYGSGGACTNAMCMMLLQTQGLTIAELLFGMQRILREKRYNQNPQLSTLRPIDFNQPFTLSGPLLSEPTDNSSSRRNSATRRQSLEMAT